MLGLVATGTLMVEAEALPTSLCWLFNERTSLSS
jgi:hypothetical protein